jgi:hypothetical protein
LSSNDVWQTTCIVTNFGEFTVNTSGCSVLIIPSTSPLPGLSKFPYFSRGGGPEPDKMPTKDPRHFMVHVSGWGEWTLEKVYFFAWNVVDGIVHEMGS